MKYMKLKNRQEEKIKRKYFNYETKNTYMIFSNMKK